MSKTKIPNSYPLSDENSNSISEGMLPKMDSEKEMEKYNIKCVSVPSYHYNNYQYTNLIDAISQAKRDFK